ncbi:MAG: myo-inosose-2 dehydratase, partial [Selenomonadaceae bacterium]|nr:myo-inosose-2 dehydratase [Selenomonadaceae bacterium]
MAKIKLGIAPIAWTNDDMPDLGKENTFEQCVSEMALAGFTGCEVGGKYPKDTNVLKKALDLRGMSIASAWFSSFLLTQPYEQVEKDFIAHCEFLHTMGAKFCNVAEQGNSIQGKFDKAVFADKPYNTEEQWK